MNISSALYEYFNQDTFRRRSLSELGKPKDNGAKSDSAHGGGPVFTPRPAFPRALLSELDRNALEAAVRPVKMSLFHFSNNNLSVRRQCAREVGMYDPAVQAEDVDLCFRIALKTNWIPCREKGVVVRHKGRPTIRALLRQMWGYGYKVGYPYAKTGMRGAYLYYLDGLSKLKWQVELTRLPFLVCIIATEFYILPMALALSLVGLLTGRLWMVVGGIAVGIWAARRYVLGLDRGSMPLANYVRLTLLRYVTDWTFVVGGFAGGLRRGVILVPCPVLPSSDANDPSGEDHAEEPNDLGMMQPEQPRTNVG